MLKNNNNKKSFKGGYLARTENNNTKQLFYVPNCSKHRINFSFREGHGFFVTLQYHKMLKFSVGPLGVVMLMLKNNNKKIF